MYCPGCKFMRSHRDWKPSQWCRWQAKNEWFTNCKICNGENRDYGLGWRPGGELLRRSPTTGFGFESRVNDNADVFCAAGSSRDTPHPSSCIVESRDDEHGDVVCASGCSRDTFDPSSCAVGKGGALTFLVTIRRVHRTKLGFTVAVDGGVVLIHAVDENGSVSGWNNKCRSCAVFEVVNQQLLQSDRVVNINGQTEPLGIIRQLLDVNIQCFHMRICRLV